MTDNKFANRILKISKKSQQNNLGTVSNENDEEITKERDTSPKEIQETIDDLRLQEYNNGLSKNHKSFEKLTTK